MKNANIMKSLADRKLIRRIAEGLGLTTQAVYAWDRVPAEKVVRVEEITGIPREELRPDLYERRAV
jgi:DNA-binding transcriptional regulator YdaS (Cro superfamily)